MLDLLAEGQLPATGFVRQEDVGLDDFLANRFGRVYAGELEHVDDSPKKRLDAPPH